jgi:hypothetical protein
MAIIDKLTQEQKKKYGEIQEKIKKLAQKQRLMVTRASQQDRKDATRRAIVTGQLLFSKAANDDKTKLALENLLREGVAENMRYLFPTLWPNAKRPIRKRAPKEQEEPKEA